MSSSLTEENARREREQIEALEREAALAEPRIKERGPRKKLLFTLIALALLGLVLLATFSHGFTLFIKWLVILFIELVLRMARLIFRF